ncbi:MAG: Asp-tRNA(Asn)/Glu-tRNA(Gln) amidotransferase subunit GatA [Saprospiraceae bacterium]|nr:Asp-tRNA(Asn)/Glu-tRNA(Gln) amidotransferase subunit GatA [Saprospiraceae bacterium]
MQRLNSLLDTRTAISQSQTTCLALVEHYLERIEATRHLNIYIEVYEAEARQRARELDEKFQQNPASVGKLFGAVISLKDVICYAGHEVTAGSKILKGFKSLFSATAVERLLAEDAILIGRVNCDEFAMGSTNETSCYGPTRNAADPTKVPGGSSGASAVAVQAGTCWASIGSDTGGSVRQPAAFCGVVGFKPTYGRISRHGLLAYASSFDQIGILANSAADAALLLEVMAGPDEFDATCSEQPVEAYSKSNFDKPARIAYFDTALDHPGMDEGVKKLTFDFIEKLRADGHSVEPVGFEYLDFIIPAYYVLTTAEASSNLSRYDGIRFGHRTQGAMDIHEVYKKSRTEGFGTEVKRRIMLGTFVLSAGYYDAYYAKAQQVRRLILERTEEILKNFDFILMPASPTPAWNIGEMADDPVAMYLADIFTVQANMVGMPAIALPIGQHPCGLPVGVQFMAGRFEEAKLLGFSANLETA